MRARTSRIFEARAAPPATTWRMGGPAGTDAGDFEETEAVRRRSGATGLLAIVRSRGSARRTFRLPLLRAAVLFLDPGIDLLSVDLHLGGSFDAQLHLPGAHFEHGDLHRIPDA